MNILLTGANGYVGKRLLPALVRNGHKVICCVRDHKRFNPPMALKDSIEIIEVDFLKPESLKQIPKNIDGAYYLMHSMSTSDDYQRLELESARNFRESVNLTNLEHVIFLSGISNEQVLSQHLTSRRAVEDELNKGKYSLTTFRAGIIIGSGSASFEIIRDLVEKLPIMITPKWLNTKSQPIAIGDVIKYLERGLFNRKLYNKNFDIGGEDILSYKDMLLGYAKARGMKRLIITVPVMTPKLSSYWLYFVTSVSYKLASALVSSMKVEIVCRRNSLREVLGIEPLTYINSLEKTIAEIEDNQIISSWKDSVVSGILMLNISDFIAVPTHGCYKDVRKNAVLDRVTTIDRIWKIGGGVGWYYGNWLWRMRGFFDKLIGGVGLRRGRTNPIEISPGDAIDFWRVLYANKDEGRLLLFAEMKLPGEAWLEFRITPQRNLIQTATFRPKGLLGRMYWYSIYPLHVFIFRMLLNRLSA